MIDTASNPLQSKPAVKPFLRWAGSKRKQLPRLATYWSGAFHRYIEPFAGSACLFFHLAPPLAVLGDTNEDLIQVYEVVRDNPIQLYHRLLLLERDQPTYDRWRSLAPGTLDRETRALRFLYLNRNCFNGIYRTNVAGEFNVPMGKRPGAYFSEQDLLRCSEMLCRVELVATDYQRTLERIRPGDFVYLDPPYAVGSRRVFRQYGKTPFQLSDFPTFSECVTAIDKVGAKFLVSYADCREARHLAKQWNATRFSVRRQVAGFAEARKNAYEWLITNTTTQSWPPVMREPHDAR
jgi:DNA adenine methylase